LQGNSIIVYVYGSLQKVKRLFFLKSCDLQFDILKVSLYLKSYSKWGDKSLRMRNLPIQIERILLYLQQ